MENGNWLRIGYGPNVPAQFEHLGTSEHLQEIACRIMKRQPSTIFTSFQLSINIFTFSIDPTAPD